MYTHNTRTHINGIIATKEKENIIIIYEFKFKIYNIRNILD